MARSEKPRSHPLPYPSAAVAPRHATPYPSTPPPRPRGVTAARRAGPPVEVPYPTARPAREQHAADALVAVGAPGVSAGIEPSPPPAPEIRAYRALLVATAVAAALLPLVLLATWYAADLGPEFTSEEVSGWDVGADAQSLAWLGFAALIGLAISAGAVPASDGERVAAALSAAALVAGAAIVWYRVAVVPEPSELFVREPGLWLATVVSTASAGVAIGYATLARITEIERLEAARARA